MDLYLQFGFGMMEHCRELITKWDGGNVILSPRDIEPDRLLSFTQELDELGGTVLFDPQFYLPHSNHDRLNSHDHWPDNYEESEFWDGDQLTVLIASLAETNNELGCDEFILPGMDTKSIDDEWLERQEAILEEAKDYRDDFDIFSTVAISSKVVKDDDQVQTLIEAVESWNTDGIYLMCGHPESMYLVDDPAWIANLLDLIAGFKLAGKRVIVGSANQQTLIAAVAGADAIASGTWMNVRMHSPSKFLQLADEEQKQLATWYYCAPALSEFKFALLEAAKKLGVLDLFKTPDEYESHYADVLFTARRPSAAGFTRTEAFRHYLDCLWYQASESTQNTFDETVAYHRLLLKSSEELLKTLHKHRLRGQYRDFENCLDPHSLALDILIKTRGVMLERSWSTL